MNKGDKKTLRGKIIREPMAYNAPSEK